MEKMKYLDDLQFELNKFEKFELNYPKNTNKTEYLFDELVKKLMNKELINNINNVLESLYNYLDYSNIKDKELLLERKHIK